MAVNYYYNYAEIDPDTGMCIGILTSSSAGYDQYPNYVAIASYDDSYVEKYYNQNNGKWYYDEGFENEWVPPEG